MLRVPKGSRGATVLKAQWVLLVLTEPKVPKVSRASLETALIRLRSLAVSSARKLNGSPLWWVQLVLPVQLVLLVLLVLMVQLVPLALRGRKGSRASKAHRGRKASKAPPAHRSSG